jgi:hypothetical protein
VYYEKLGVYRIQKSANALPEFSREGVHWVPFGSYKVMQRRDFWSLTMLWKCSGDTSNVIGSYSQSSASSSPAFLDGVTLVQKRIAGNLLVSCHLSHFAPLSTASRALLDAAYWMKGCSSLGRLATGLYCALDIARIRVSAWPTSKEGVTAAAPAAAAGYKGQGISCRARRRQLPVSDKERRWTT